MVRASKNTEPVLIEDAVSLAELWRRTGILAVANDGGDPITAALRRYGLGDKIGINFAGDASVSAETASRFLSGYELTKDEHSAKRAAYERYLQERAAKAATERAEQRQKAWDAKVARQSKVDAARRAERERIAQEKLKAAAAARAKSDPGLSWTEFSKEWEKSEGRQ